jgi:hypothetical protein
MYSIQERRVKSIGTSIIVFSGAVCLCAGAFIPESLAKTIIVMGAGVLLIAFGILVSMMVLVPRRESSDDDDDDDF